MLKVHFTPGDGSGWALDEDLRQIRRALEGAVEPVVSARADVLHAPFWPNLAMVAPALRAGTFVIAHADNPPFFYLRQPAFAAGQTWVDLWVARSREALAQFRALRLPAVHVPYTIDPDLFFPIAERAALRREFGLPEGKYVIANFHRDSEGADVGTPKLQKAPEFLLAILRRLRERDVDFHVLLAGPRRHWLREQLRRAGIPFTFVGREDVAGDDYGVNILDRRQLNRLYNAADLHLIPSRWEGGPQSAMEAAACRCPQLSVPLGVARDILEPVSLFRTAEEGAKRIAEDLRAGTLRAAVDVQFERWRQSHTTATLARELRALYATLGERPEFRAKVGRRRGTFFRALRQGRHELRRRLRAPALPRVVGWNHRTGENADLDAVMAQVRALLGELDVAVTEAGGEIEMVGVPARTVSPRGAAVQWIVPGFLPKSAAIIAAPAVQDVVNFRAAGGTNPAVVLPVPVSAEASSAPLIVPRDERNASLEIWRALAAGRPVVYPADSAYSEQVFHGGVSYATDDERDRAVAFATANAEELRELARPVSAEAARSALRDLLLSLAS